VTTFDLAELKEEKAELDATMSEPGFWDNPREAREVSKRADRVKNQIETYEDLSEILNDLEAMVELAREGEDESFADEIASKIKRSRAMITVLRRRYYLSGEYDDRHAILSINPGAGGTEAHDWAEMLYRMYRRWCDEHDIEYEILNHTPADEAGIKNVTLLIKDEYAYGRLKGESGVHRLIRISPFDEGGRRHTSFAAVQVTPKIDFDAEVDLEEKDLTVETFKASGPGGQHVNVTDSAVRVTHEPTDTVVSCQNERSQHRNREMAMEILRSRLLEQKIQEQKEDINQITGDEKKIEWGNQIRSYFKHPNERVKDHRTDVELHQFDDVLDGEIDEFIDAYLASSENNSSS
jgi:peptide chain release factor 2